MGRQGFVFKENHGGPNHTRIHGVGCSHARPPGYRTSGTTWYPLSGDPYRTYQEAWAAAEAIERPGPYTCFYCQRAGRILV